VRARAARLVVQPRAWSRRPVRGQAALVEHDTVRLVIPEVHEEDTEMTAPEITIPKPLLWPTVALGTAIGWTIGTILISVGWTAGRVALIASYFAEAVVYGFRVGAKIGPKQFSPPERAPKRPDNSKV
jgi:hypothetical protein